MSDVHGRRDTALHPIAIVADRYGGTYSNGSWLAVGEADRALGMASRVDWIIHDGPSGEDEVAASFWADPPDWIAVGDSPDAALRSLRGKAASSS